ncbi:MAG: hypothetical protein EOO45_31425 [Flavobacterium sp.]|nr:MAG: hypothetical protein EOO45_31425 [Flavobacterium sp.]
MKSFKSYLNASIAEDRNQFHIIVIGDTADIEVTEEGAWMDSTIKDYWKRAERPGEESGEVHLHIARKKHVNTKMRKISWHVNGFKHDKQAINNNLNGAETAKNIANTIIGLPENKMLKITPNENVAPLLQNVDYLPNKCKIFVFKVVDKE